MPPCRGPFLLLIGVLDFLILRGIIEVWKKTKSGNYTRQLGPAYLLRHRTGAVPASYLDAIQGMTTLRAFNAQDRWGEQLLDQSRPAD